MNKTVIGKYRSNFAEIGFFVTVIDLKPDSTFHYIFSGDLTHTELDGTYKTKKRNLYLRFNKLKEEYKPLVFGTTENPDTILNFEDWQNSHSYDLKKENDIEYHLKYQIDSEKLKVYNIETDKVVRRAKYFSDKKRYVFFGPSFKKKKWYLKRIN
jgi:hypothetical protein